MRKTQWFRKQTEPSCKQTHPETLLAAVVKKIVMTPNSDLRNFVLICFDQA